MRVSSPASAGLALLALAALSGCAAHSIPLSNQFVYPVDAACRLAGGTPCRAKDTAEVFVDVNGSFYPSGWQKYVHPRMSKTRLGEGKWLAGSLFAEAANSRALRSLVERDSARQMLEMKAFGTQHKRVFILIHGFNATVEDARSSYEAVESGLNPQPGDGVIRFYWDGLIGKGAGVIKTWLRAANASQLAGSRGLRDIINQIDNRDIFVIAHSRGASVALSAIGNPVYKSKFVRRQKLSAIVWGKSFRGLLSPRPLAANGNALHVLLLAPAIDRIDFCDASQQPQNSKGFVCSVFRPLGNQVKSIAYTLNTGDPMLGKSILSPRALVATGLGVLPEVGRELKAQHYSLLQEYAFEKPESFHSFKQYAVHPVFAKMLIDAGIGHLPSVNPVEVEPLVP